MQLVERTLYIPMRFASVAHNCACGCGNQVITPLGRTYWQLTYDGETITLYPSIGNWNFPCQSHYWIRHNTVECAPPWTPQQISDRRAEDRRSKEKYFERTHDLTTRKSRSEVAASGTP